MIVLRTDRLVLRWFRADDAAFVLSLVRDPDWIANIGDRGLRAEDEARAWIRDRLIPPYLEHGAGLWAIERRDDGAPLGMCGFVHRPSLPALDVGYALLPAARGSGVASEAAAACLAYARDVLREPRVLAITAPTNAASIRVLERIGMRHHETRILGDETKPTAVFSWDGAAAPRDDRTAIDAVAARLFAAFENRGGAIAPVAALPAIFVPGAVVTVVTKDAVTTTGVADFMAPRAHLLEPGGRLVDFAERETEARTELAGSIAQRWSRYEKAGVLDGAAYRGRGTKTMQLVKIAGRWKIAALAWEDDA